MGNKGSAPYVRMKDSTVPVLTKDGLVLSRIIALQTKCFKKHKWMVKAIKEIACFVEHQPGDHMRSATALEWSSVIAENLINFICDPEILPGYESFIYNILSDPWPLMLTIERRPRDDASVHYSVTGPFIPYSETEQFTYFLYKCYVER